MRGMKWMTVILEMCTLFFMVQLAALSLMKKMENTFLFRMTMVMLFLMNLTPKKSKKRFIC